jgi:hypothetical protein
MQSSTTTSLIHRRAISSCAVLPIFHSPLDLQKSIPNPMQNLHTHLPPNQPPTTIPSAPPPLNLSFRTDSDVIVEAGIFAHKSPAPKIIMITSRHPEQSPFPHPSTPFPPSNPRTSIPPHSSPLSLILPLLPPTPSPSKYHTLFPNTPFNRLTPALPNEPNSTSPPIVIKNTLT